ncbi:protein FAM47E [Centroberyx gerrardi]
MTHRRILTKYKERLQTKYLKDPTNKPHLDSSSWRFLNSGLDDFRDGCPILSGAQRGVSPVIFHDTPNRTSNRVPRKCFSKEQACLSKQMVQRQNRREHVAAVEEKLLQHPLALYPHYKDYMTPELFDRVLSVLDPDMCVNSASAVPTPSAERVEEEDEESCTEPNKEEEEEVDGAEQGTPANEMQAHWHNPEIQKPRPRNPYIGLQIKQNGTKEDQSASVKQLSSLFQDDDIKKVTKLFSDWFTSLGEEPDIIESTILAHFVSSFEETPSPTLPIQVGNADHVPEERRNTVTASCRKDTDVLKDSEPNKKKPGTKKPIYGAWYLHPKMWRKKNDAGESFRDPNDMPEELEFQIQTSEKDEELKQMHVTQAFRQYIIRNGLRMPRRNEKLRRKVGSDAFGSSSAWKGNVVN